MGGKIYPIGIQNFEKLRRGGYFYIDKTALIYQLVKTGSYYILSRPRRFGKSLLISTLEAYFQGKQELFEGLAMEKLEKDWVKYPILHLDLNTEKYDTPESLENKLNGALVEWEKIYGEEPSDKSLAMRFEGIIRRACQQEGQSVVILVDEYDKPMLQAIGDDVLQKSFRNTLKAFYGALKSQDGCIKFALLTGVTKFGKVSVFSDLNNLNDISMWNKYIDICGVSEQELYDNLDAELHEFANVQGVTYEEICARLKASPSPTRWAYRSFRCIISAATSPQIIWRSRSWSRRSWRCACPAATRCSWTCGIIPTLFSSARRATTRRANASTRPRVCSGCPIPAASRWTSWRSRARAACTTCRARASRGTRST